MTTKITVHAGADGKSPENTLAAIRQSAAAGAERMELDVQESADGHLILHHFYELGHTDNGSGLIFEQSFSDLRGLDAGTWFNPRFSGERMPTLAEALDVLGPNVEYELDLKGLSPEFVPAVLRLVHARGLLGQTEFTSFFHFVLADVKRLEPAAAIGIFADTLVEPWMPERLAWKIVRGNAVLGGVAVVHHVPERLTSDYVRILQDDGFRVHAANCNTESDLEKAFALGVDQLSTDHLAMALNLRGPCRRSRWGPPVV